MNAIEMKNITMKFGDFKANDNLSLLVKKGEVHALIGENGAGKSTLMSILFGLYKPTNGSISINNKDVKISSPLVANDLGIGMVHQHFKLVEDFTVLENIVLNIEKSNILGLLTYKEARNKINKIMQKYGFEVNLKKKISSCSVAEQQRVEIIKMLYRDADVLIFDEPTAVLSPIQIKEFLNALKDLKKMGKTIIIITHKLNEIKEVADKGTVIRKGKLIGSFDVGNTSLEEMAEMMVGKKINPTVNKHSSEIGKAMLSIENLWVNDEFRTSISKLEDFSLEVRSGEIVAIAGVEGNGQTELINVITGLQKAKKGKVILHNHLTFVETTNKAGEIVHKKFNYNNRNVKKWTKKYKEKPNVISVKQDTDLRTINIKKKYESGIAHIPEDRHKYGLVLDMPLWENTILQDYRNEPFSNHGLLSSREIKKYTNEIIHNFDVRSSRGMYDLARTLSGGNQQKFIVGRELSKDAELLIVAQPTRGLDIGAIENIHSYILKAKASKKAILLISYELEEVMALADRIIVVNAKRKVGEVSSENVTKELLGQMMAGVSLAKNKENVEVDNE